MFRIGTKRLYFCGAAAASVVLVYGSVQTTDALWSSQSTAAGGTVSAGTFVLTAGAGGASQVQNYAFAALGQATPIVPDQFVQKPLTLQNGGNAALRFSVSSVAVAATGGSVTVHLDAVAVGTSAACTATGIPTGTSVLSVDVTSGVAASITPVYTPLAIAASQVLCVRTTLKAAPAATSTQYTQTFSFLAEQVYI